MATEIHAEPAAKRPGEAPGKMTYEEFLHWEGDNQHVEWVDGQMIFVSSVSKAHQDLGLFLLTALKAFVDTGQIGVVLFEPFQMKTGPDLPGRAPDIMFVAQQNLGRLKRNHLEGPDDLAVEIK